MKRHSQKMDEMAVLLRQLVLKADADPSVDVKTVASTTKSRRSTSKQKGMRKDTPIDVPDYSSNHLAFHHSRRKRKTSSIGTPKQIISEKNDKFTVRTLFSDKKERTPQTNEIGPSRPATHIGERPYVDLTVQGFYPNQAEVDDKIPENTMFTFYPQKEMRLAGTDLAVAAYIFGMEKDKREILVSDLHCYGDREAFQTLVPGRRVVDDIIILVATMLTYNSGRLIWYLPPMFVQLACGRGHFHDGTAKWIRDKYMAKIDEVLKIYVPIWHDHWFLLLLYLDSARLAKQRESHVLQIKKVALFLEEIALYESWYACKRHERPTISEFKLVEPEVNQQEVGINDCGVWVCQWMILSRLSGSHNVEKVTEYTRMKLAIDLVLKPHNEIRQDIINKAMENWRRLSQIFFKESDATSSQPALYKPNFLENDPCLA
ncbi:hypothetical protein Ahy_A09g042697 isoform A [Arachis hypogaea]|uniref:Ubiquitin-like protease family profile domain-containing protein n=1 Tax=Arachis hypogaea TaxID=3818 RepID=A0A445BGJ8_ARAHY|nr:hypothetical protein Ahy_A09g042697 isoform A [Arachis hypogaea]